jgi:outer membrane immunogenic protein
MADPMWSTPNWNGFYLGLNAGGDFGNSKGSTSEYCSGAGGSCYIASYNTAINALGFDQKINTTGFTGGAQAGYNLQRGSWLVGLETDFDYFGSRGSKSVTVTTPGTLTIDSAVKTDWLLTARPRLGVVTGNWLFYGTGGLAITDLRGTWSFANAPYSENASQQSTKMGWTIGAGVEARISDHWCSVPLHKIRWPIGRRRNWCSRNCAL